MRRPAVAIVAVLAAFTAPAAAHASLVWSPAQTVSIAEQNGASPDVAFDAAGNATAVWTEDDGTHSVVRVATAPPGGFFTVAPAPLSAAGGVVADPQIAVAPDGSASALWMQRFQTGPPARYNAEYSFRAAGSTTWSTPVNLSGTTTSAVSVQIAMDPGGDTLAAWALENDLSDATRPPPVLQTRFRPHGGSFGATQSVYQAGANAAADGLIGDVRLVFDEQGNALLAWDGRDSSFNQDRFSTDIRASERPANGVFETSQLLAQRGSEQETDLAGATMHNGAAIVAWNRSDGGMNEGDAELSYRTSSSGPWEAEQTLVGSIHTPGTPAFLGDVLFDPAGDALAALNVTGSTPGSVSLMAAGTALFGAPTAALPAGVSPFGIGLGVDATSTYTMLYRATVGSDTHLFATSRTPGSGAWDSPQDLAGPIEGSDILGVAPTGNAVAMWVQSDGSNDAVELSAGALPSPTPTPPVVTPPPPQPEPPVPSAIQLARPMTSDQATIATVTVSGDTTRLEWKIGSSGPTIVGAVVGGVLQRSIRFRAPRGPFSVKVTAFGPGGSKSFSRSLSGPKAPTDSDGEKVLQHLEDAVYATGSEAVLDGKSSSCGPVTIYAGAHTLSGCFKPAEELGDIPSPARGVLVDIAHALGLNSSDADLMRRAVELTDGYVATGQVLIDSTWPVIPRSGAAIVSYPQAHALTSANASLLVGGINVGATSSGFDLTLDTSPGPIPLGAIPPPAGNQGIGGFPFVGDFSVSLNSGFATIRTNVRVSAAVEIAGNPIWAPVTLTATPTSINVPDGLTIGPYNVDFGLLPLHQFLVRYDKASNTWAGSATACIFTDQCIDMQPPDGGLVFVNGDLVKAAASFDYGNPGKPLAPGVFLENVGAGFGFNPSRLFGHARIGVGQFIKVDGRMVLAAPSSSAPYLLQRDEAGDAFPASYYTTPLTRPLIAMSADEILTLPVIGDTTLANGYLLYEFPGFISVGGSTSLNVLGIVSYSGAVAGQYDVTKQAYNLHGDIRACLIAVKGICAGSVANFSRGPNLQGGAGACLSVGPLNIGGGVQWSHPQTPIIWPIDGCKWSRFKIDINPSRAIVAAASQAYSVTIKRGAPSRAIRLSGAGESPSVTITGPGGASLASTDKGLDYTPDGRLRIVRYDGAGGHFTTIGFDNAKPGHYTIALQPGSAPVTQFADASNPPDARVTGHVTGTGANRVLHYDVLSRPDQTVQFSDVSSGKDARAIGTISGGGRGTIRFDAAPGKKPRAIVAQFTLDGLAAETRTVTHYTPPPPTLPAPAHLKLRRANKGNKLTVSWRAVRDAVSYQLAVTTSVGRQRFSSTKRLRVVLTGIGPAVSGKVTVRAVAPLREGKLARTTLKRTAAAERTYRRLPKCKVQKKKLVCH